MTHTDSSPRTRAATGYFPAVLPPARRLAEKRVAMVSPPLREALADLPAGKRAKAAAPEQDDEDVKPARAAKADAKADKAKLARADDKAGKAKTAKKDKDAEERSEVAKAESNKADAAKSRNAAARDGLRPSGWSIQIGATDNVEKANALLARARGAVHLAAAKSYTEKVQKGSATLYRARFAGLETDQAQTACKQLKRSGFACFATKD